MYSTIILLSLFGLVALFSFLGYKKPFNEKMNKFDKFIENW